MLTEMPDGRGSDPSPLGVVTRLTKERPMPFNAVPAERRLLSELGTLSVRLRTLRAGVRPDSREIRPLEAQVSLRWQELRSLRAGPLNAEALPAPQNSRSNRA